MMQLRSAAVLRSLQISGPAARSAFSHNPQRRCNGVSWIAAVRSVTAIAAATPSRGYAVPTSPSPQSSEELEALWNRARSFTPAAAVPAVAPTAENASDDSDVALSAGEPQSRPLQWMLRELEHHVGVLGVRFHEIGLPSASTNHVAAAESTAAAATASPQPDSSAGATNVDVLRSSLTRADELLSELLASLSSAPTHPANVLTLANYRTILRLLATDSFAAHLDAPGAADAGSPRDTAAVRVSDLQRHVSPFARLLLLQVESLLPVSHRAPALTPTALTKVASKNRRLGLGWPSRDWRSAALGRSTHVASRRAAHPLLYVDMERVDEIVSIVTSAPQPVQKGATALPSSQACAGSLAQLIEEALSRELSDANQLLSRVESNPTFGPLVTSQPIVGSLESNAQISAAAHRLWTELQSLSELLKRQFSDEQLSRLGRGLDSSSAYESLKQEAHVLLVSIQSLLDRGAQLPIEETGVLLTETIPLFHLHVLALPLYRVLLASHTAVLENWYAAQRLEQGADAPRRPPPFSLRMHLPQALTDSVLRSIGLAHSDDIDVPLQFLANLAGERHMTPMSINATNDLLAAYADRLVEDVAKRKRGQSGFTSEEARAHKTRTAQARYNLRLLSRSLRERNHVSNSILIRAMIGSGETLETLVRMCNAMLSSKTNVDSEMFVMMLNVVSEEISARRDKRSEEQEEKTQLEESAAAASTSGDASTPAAPTTSISLPASASPSQLLHITARDLLCIAQDRRLVSPALCASFLRAHAQLDDLQGMVQALEELRAFECSDRAIPPPHPTVPPLTQQQLQSGMDDRQMRLIQAVASCMQSPPFLDANVFELAFEKVCVPADRFQARGVVLFERLRAVVQGLEEPRRSSVLFQTSRFIFQVLMTMDRPAAELVDAWIALPPAVKVTQADRLEFLFDYVSVRGDLDAAKKLSTDIDRSGLVWDASMLAAWMRCCLRRHKPHGGASFKTKQPWDVARTIFNSARGRRVHPDSNMVASLACVWMSWGGRELMTELKTLVAHYMAPRSRLHFGVREWSAVFAAAREADLPTQVLMWYERAEKVDALRLLSKEAMEIVKWAEAIIDEKNAASASQLPRDAKKAAKSAITAEEGTPLWRIQTMLSGSEADVLVVDAAPLNQPTAASDATFVSPTPAAATAPRPRRRDRLDEYRLFLPVLNGLASSGDVAQAEKVIAEFESHGVAWDIAVITAWIRCYEYAADWVGATKAWERMKQLKLRPTRLTYLAMFLVGTRAGQTEAVDALYADLLKGTSASQSFLMDDFVQLILLCHQLRRRTETKHWCIRAQAEKLWTHMPAAVIEIAESVGGLPVDGKENRPEWHIMKVRAQRNPPAYLFMTAIRSCLLDGSPAHLAQSEELYGEMLSRSLNFTAAQFAKVIFSASRCPRLPNAQVKTWLRRAASKGFDSEESFSDTRVREIVRKHAAKNVDPEAVENAVDVSSVASHDGATAALDSGAIASERA